MSRKKQKTDEKKQKKKKNKKNKEIDKFTHAMTMLRLSSKFNDLRLYSYIFKVLLAGPTGF